MISFLYDFTRLYISNNLIVLRYYNDNYVPKGVIGLAWCELP